MTRTPMIGPLLVRPLRLELEPIADVVPALELPANVPNGLAARAPSGSVGPTGLLVGRLSGAPPPVVFPSFDLAKAMSDSSFQAWDPAAAKLQVPSGFTAGRFRPPAALLEQIARAKSIIVLGHRVPDLDTAGSGLAVSGLLRSLGKEVDVCIDDELPGEIKHLDQEGRIRRAEAYAGQTYDLAIVVDAGDPDLIGPGSMGLVNRARDVAVIDHHNLDPGPADFGVTEPGRTFSSWIGFGFPAAGLQVGILASVLCGGSPPKDALLGAMAGITSDTRWGVVGGYDPDWYRYLKHMLGSAGMSLAELEAKSTVRRPSAVVGALSSAESPLVEKRFGDRLALLSITKTEVDRLVALGQSEIPEFNASDLSFELKDRLDHLVKPSGSAEVAALFIEDTDLIRISTRSEHPDEAIAAAKALHPKGGGKPRIGGAARTGTLVEAELALLDWAGLSSKLGV